MEKKKKKGFTLVEMIVVMAIIAILAGIAVPQVMKAIQKSKVTADVASARNIAGAIQQAMAEGINLNHTTAWTKLSDLKDDDDKTINLTKYIDEIPTSKVNKTYVFYYKYDSTNNKLQIGSGPASGSSIVIRELYPTLDPEYR